MSRPRIAAALSTVEGVSGHPWRPHTPVPGSAWPEWERTSYETAVCGPQPETEWSVYLMLPAIEPQAWDGRWTQLVAAALATVGGVESAEPAEVQLQQETPTGAPAIRFRMTTTHREDQ